MSASPDVAKPPVTITIFVNNNAVEMHQHEATGAEIKKAAGVPANFTLYGPEGDEIADGHHVHLQAGEKFTAISGQDVS